MLQTLYFDPQFDSRNFNGSRLYKLLIKYVENAIINKDLEALGLLEK